MQEAVIVAEFNTNQPYRGYTRYRLTDGTEVVVHTSGFMAQTWDCQPYRQSPRIKSIDGPTTDPRVIAETLAASFPTDKVLQQLLLQQLEEKA